MALVPQEVEARPNVGPGLFITDTIGGIHVGRPVDPAGYGKCCDQEDDHCRPDKDFHPEGKKLLPDAIHHHPGKVVPTCAAQDAGNEQVYHEIPAQDRYYPGNRGPHYLSDPNLLGAVQDAQRNQGV